MVKRLGPLNHLVKISDQTKKVHVNYLMAANSDLSDKGSADDWDTILFWRYHKMKLIPQVAMLIIL